MFSMLRDGHVKLVQIISCNPSDVCYYLKSGVQRKCSINFHVQCTCVTLDETFEHDYCTTVPHCNITVPRTKLTVPLRTEKAMPVAITTTTIFRLTQNSHPTVITPFCNLIFLRASTLKMKVKAEATDSRICGIFTWVGHVAGDEECDNGSTDDDDDVARDANEPSNMKRGALTTRYVVSGLSVCSEGDQCQPIN